MTVTVALVAAVTIEACEAGHVHLILHTGPNDAIQGIFTPAEAVELAMTLIAAAKDAARMAKDAPAGADAEPCTLH